jgi:hypothetical protein
MEDGEEIDAGEIAIPEAAAGETRILSGYSTQSIRDRLDHQLLGNVWEVLTANEVADTPTTIGVPFLASSLLTETIKGPGDLSIDTGGFEPSLSTGAVITSEQNFAPDQFDLDAVVCVDGTPGDDITAYIRLWDASESSYFSVTQRQGVIQNFAGPDDMTSITLFATITAQVGDRVEIWLSNDTALRQVTLCDQTVLKIRGI